MVQSRKRKQYPTTPSRRSRRIEAQTPSNSSSSQPSSPLKSPSEQRDLPRFYLPTILATTTQVLDDPATPPTLLTLPTKIRSQILTYLLPTRQTISHKTNHILEFLATNRTELEYEKVLAIGRVNKQLNSEVALHYYANNHFTFPSMYNLQVFLSHVSLQNRALLRSVFFIWDFMMVEQAFELLMDCEEVKKIETFLVPNSGREMEGVEGFKKVLKKLGEGVELVIKANAEDEDGEYGPWRFDKGRECVFGPRQRKRFRAILLGEEKKGGVFKEGRVLEMKRRERSVWVRENLKTDTEEFEMLLEMGRERRRLWELENSRSN